MLNKYYKNIQGFTFVEALLVVTIFALILTASFSLSNSQIFEDDLQAKVLQVSDLIERARNNSATGFRSDVWSIKVLNDHALCEDSGDCVLMFKGTDFSGRDTSYDSFVQFDQNITGVYFDADQENEFYFEYDSGWLSTTTAGVRAALDQQYINLENNVGDKQSIVVHPSGAISVFVCGEDQVFDKNGNAYNTFSFTLSNGTAYCWTAENLNTGTMLAAVTDEPSDNDIVEKWCYGDTSSNCDIYGGLYKWTEAMEYGVSSGAQGICPAGWHIPTSVDFVALNINKATELKIGGSSGFDLLMAGIRVESAPDYYSDADGGGDDTGYMWSSEVDGINSTIYYIVEDLDSLSSQANDRDYGASIRCVRDY